MLYIGEKFRISADPHNIILEQYKTVKQKDEESTEKWVRLGFYNSIEGACTRILKQCAKDLLDKTTVKELMNELNKIKDTIVNATAHIQVIEREESKRGKKATDNDEDGEEN